MEEIGKALRKARKALGALALSRLPRRVAIRAVGHLGPAWLRASQKVGANEMAAASRVPQEQGRRGRACCTALHEEITTSPKESFRRAVLLYGARHVPQARAATELRVSERTLQRRLSEARERLKVRLIRRGLAPDGGMLAAVILREARLAVPAAWREMTVRAALVTVNPSLTVGVASAGARQLTREVAGLMSHPKASQMASTTLLAAGLISWGASAALVSQQEKATQKLAARANTASRGTAETAGPQPGPNSLDTPGKVAFRGRVLAPDERPVAGAKLYMTLAWGYPHEPSPSAEYATSGPDDHFRFAVSSSWNSRTSSPSSRATSPNFGVGWVNLSPDDQRDELTIRLAGDDVPITGQIIDLEGKPVPGANVRLMQINAAPGEDLGPWLEAVKGKKGPRLELEQRYLNRFTLAVPLQVTTDSAGRFRLTGIGRNRLVTALDGGDHHIGANSHTNAQWESDRNGGNRGRPEPDCHVPWC